MTDDQHPNDVGVIDDQPRPEASALRRFGRGGPGLPVMAGLSDAAERSADPDTCPFLRSVDVAGGIATPIETPDLLNRCLAIDHPTPQSVRQQELVCLTAGHVNCPRYLRGAVASHQAATVAAVRHQAPSSPVLASVIVLVLSASASVGFLLMGGGLALALPSASPGASAAASQVAVVTSPGPSGAASPIATARPSPTPTPTATPSPSPSPTSVPTVAPTPPPTPVATPRPTPRPTAASNRYAVLVPCPDAASCWIYTVRAGDNFQSIVNWFGVPYDTVVAMNPRLGDPGTIHVGDRIRMPPPTR
jgi:hypothetical protein